MISKSKLLFVGLVACACGALLSSPAHADTQPGTVRYFLEFLPYEGEGQDWEATGSRRIVAHYDGNSFNDQLEFGTWDYVSTYPEDFRICDADGRVLLDLANTTWVRMPVLLVTDGVFQVGSVYWLVTEPEEPDDLPQLLAGATAATGPNGDVVVVAESALGTLNDGTWYISPSYRVRISMGVFNK